MPSLTRLTSRQADFPRQLAGLLALEEGDNSAIIQRVVEILRDVRVRGDAAVVEYTNRFDGLAAVSMAELAIPLERCRKALEDLPAADRQALELSVARVRSYHQRQKMESWTYTDEEGVLLGQKITALQKVGLYVPGGRAAYPSSVVMNAVPAKVAGVDRLIMVTPTPKGEINPLVLAAVALCEVDEVYAVGGAQAVAALAYGTATVPQVDKIVGPGNAYVAEAKRQVFGTVGIDMVAGPSEILIIADGRTPADWLAMDLFSQAEHDDMAQSILISPDAAYLDAVQEAVDRLLPEMSRREIIEKSLSSRGALIEVASLEEAVEVANYIAPEHLELSVEDPEALLPALRNAGAIFMGRYTSEALGDYCAGPNHVLPTSRTARFSSPLGVYDFQKRSSLIGAGAAAAAKLGEVSARLAKGEGLDAHARSAEYRIER